MKFLPTSEREWLRFLATPFKTFIFAYGVIYLVWMFSAPGRPGTMGGPDASVLFSLTIGCLLTSLILFMIAVGQALSKDRRDALWNMIFAVVALCLTAFGLFQPAYR